MQYDDPNYEEAEADFYDDDDCCPPKEEPSCHGCSDSGWYRPRGWRLLAAQFAPIIWGRQPAWRWRPRRGAWPCQGCNPCWLDWQLHRLDHWRFRFRRNRRVVGAYYDDEPPF